MASRWPRTAILPFLGKRFDLWPEDALAEAKALSLIGFFASSVHVAFAHVSRPERYASDSTSFPTLKDTGLKAFHGYLKEIDGMLAEREWFSDRYTVLDPYGFVTPPGHQGSGHPMRWPRRRRLGPRTQSPLPRTRSRNNSYLSAVA